MNTNELSRALSPLAALIADFYGEFGFGYTRHSGEWPPGTDRENIVRRSLAFAEKHHVAVGESEVARWGNPEMPGVSVIDSLISCWIVAQEESFGEEVFMQLGSVQAVILHTMASPDGIPALWLCGHRHKGEEFAGSRVLGAMADLLLREHALHVLA